MRTFVPAVLLFLVGCPEPPKTARREQIIQGLAHLHSWDARTEAQGQYAYDLAMGSDPEAWPHLVAHLTDLTPTAIYEPITRRNPVVGDVCFFILLRLLNLKWQDFSDDGVFVSTAFESPVFCLHWKDADARKRAQIRFLPLIPAMPK